MAQYYSSCATAELDGFPSYSIRRHNKSEVRFETNKSFILRACVRGLITITGIFPVKWVVVSGKGAVFGGTVLISAMTELIR